MSKLLKFRKLLNIEEAIRLLSELIAEEVTLIDIVELMKRGFLTSYSYRYLALAEVEETKDKFYKIITKSTGLCLPLVPNLKFTYLNIENGKIYILASKQSKKLYTFINEQGSLIENCIEKDHDKLYFLPKDIYQIAELANKNEAVQAKYGKQEIPVEILDQKYNKFLDHIVMYYYYNFDKDELADINQKAQKKKVSENNQQVAIGLLIKLLINGERCPKQEAIIEAILTNYPKIHGISRATLANLFSDANKQRIEAIKK